MAKVALWTNTVIMKSYRNRGLSKCLYGEVERICRDNNIDKVVGFVVSDAMVSILETVGFTISKDKTCVKKLSETNIFIKRFPVDYHIRISMLDEEIPREFPKRFKNIDGDYFRISVIEKNNIAGVTKLKIPCL